MVPVHIDKGGLHLEVAESCLTKTGLCHMETKGSWPMWSMGQSVGSAPWVAWRSSLVSPINQDGLAPDSLWII